MKNKEVKYLDCHLKENMVISPLTLIERRAYAQKNVCFYETGPAR